MSASTASGSMLATTGDERPTVGDKPQSTAEALEEGLVGMRRNARAHERVTDTVTTMLIVVDLVILVLGLVTTARQETSQTAITLLIVECGINNTTYGFIQLWERLEPETTSLLLHQYEALQGESAHAQARTSSG